LTSSWYFRTNEEERKERIETEGSSTSSPIDDDYRGRNYYIYGYTGITIALVLVTKARAVYFFHFCMGISVNIHNKMFTSVVRAPTRFFDDNPSGKCIVLAHAVSSNYNLEF